jgi:pyruvate/2-oxoglutarate dehydrogenase complex dihydrolipoamide acyltransferase (E2) component
MPRFRPAPRPSAFRQIAAAMWDAPRDPSINGSVDVDATEALSAIAAHRARGVRLTITHLVARAVALTIARNPDANAKVRFWGRIERRTVVDVFVNVASHDGKDLSGARIDGADQKSLAAIADELEKKARGIRSGEDAAHEKSRGLLRSLPWWLAAPALRASDVVVNELHLDLPGLGMPLDPFGSAMITNVGMFGIDTAFAPFTPIARCPILILVPEIRDRPVALAGVVVVRPVLRLCATFDHRIIDGALAGLLCRDVVGFLADPARLELPGGG